MCRQCSDAQRSACTNECMAEIAQIEAPLLTADDVIASWGQRGSRLASARVVHLLTELLSQVNAEGWIQPKACFSVLPVTWKGSSRVDVEGGYQIVSPRLRHHFSGALFIAAGVCTIGREIEERVRKGFAESDRLRAVLLDDIGTLALFRVGDRLEEILRAEASGRRLEPSGVLNPGEDGLDIRQQATLLEMVKAGQIEVSQSASGMLAPRKSISMLLGMGTGMRTWTRGERCAVCAARDRCPHRRPSPVEVSA
jgi:hypothetical protein